MIQIEGEKWVKNETRCKQMESNAKKASRDHVGLQLAAPSVTPSVTHSCCSFLLLPEPEVFPSCDELAEEPHLQSLRNLLEVHLSSFELIVHVPVLQLIQLIQLSEVLQVWEVCEKCSLNRRERERDMQRHAATCSDMQPDDLLDVEWCRIEFWVFLSTNIKHLHGCSTIFDFHRCSQYVHSSNMFIERWFWRHNILPKRVFVGCLFRIFIES